MKYKNGNMPSSGGEDIDLGYMHFIQISGISDVLIYDGIVRLRTDVTGAVDGR